MARGLPIAIPFNHTQPKDKSQHILPENRVIMTLFKDPKTSAAVTLRGRTHHHTHRPGIIRG